MSLHDEIIQREELKEIISELEQASYYHQKWCASVIRVLACGLSTDKEDMSESAHKNCKFGQWYHIYAPIKLSRHPGFIALGEEHHQLHKIATKLLFIANRDLKVPVALYDSFVNSLENMKLDLSSMQRELIELLHNKDPLTGTIYRINMLPVLHEQLDLIKRTRQASSIAMMNIDHFNLINQQYGQHTGDTVLSSICHYIIKNIRPFDKIFRIGGEEFLLLIQNTNTKAAYELIERIREGIANLKIKVEPDKEVQLTVSFGVTLLDPEITIEESIKIVEKALSKAKTAGRNCTRVIPFESQ